MCLIDAVLDEVDDNKADYTETFFFITLQGQKDYRLLSTAEPKLLYPSVASQNESAVKKIFKITTFLALY